MHYLNKYFKSILVYDLLNKFNYTNIKKFPEITKVILILNTKEYNLKALISSLFCLELVSKKKSALVFSKQNNIKINIKKGNPIGCKVTLRNNSMHLFIAKLTRLHKINLSRPLKNYNNLSFNIKSSYIFPVIEKYYYHFRNIYSLNVIIVSNTKTQKEFSYLLNSYKFLVNKKQK